jgi:hypothetical protein
MFRRRRRHSEFHAPSLVPLADMLTNTVGIVVFILIFTVLTAGGAISVRRLPIEHDTDIHSTEYYLCMGGKIYPLRDDTVQKLLKPLQDNAPPSTDSFQAYATRADGASTQDEFVKVTLKAQYFEDQFRFGVRQSLRFDALPDAGLYAGEVGDSSGFFRQDLAKYDPKTDAILFFVKPDSIDAFIAARDLAERQGFAWNWDTEDPATPMTINLGGDGGSPGFTGL